MSETFDEHYYEGQQLNGDRLALWWYARIVRRLTPPGGRVFEFGCGYGYLLRRLSRHFTCTGYDVSPVARQHAAQVAPAARLVEDCATLEPEQFDTVVSLHTLEHVPEPGDILQMLTRTLVPGGRLLFVVPNPDGLGKRLKDKDWFAYRDPTHCSLLSREKWLELVRRAGLTLVGIQGDGMWDSPYIPLLPAIVQRMIFEAPAALQLLSPTARPFLPPYLGECLVVTAERPQIKS